ncbi:hypothetical protein AALP_AAs61759U000200 [Arabis alpina]|uniref:Uncharacterized protein n=1 Tax=Arabis alpina TaxID=50452 RepID=A0A087FYD2_ARAAL|nr:hypothetical protein AALP_AAs61759U000200 [Arabis alpina]
MLETTLDLTSRSRLCSTGSRDHKPHPSPAELQLKSSPEKLRGSSEKLCGSPGKFSDHRQPQFSLSIHRDGISVKMGLGVDVMSLARPHFLMLIWSMILIIAGPALLVKKFRFEKSLMLMSLFDFFFEESKVLWILKSCNPFPVGEKNVMIPFKAFGTMAMARELKQHAEEISGVVFTSDEILVSQKTSFIITENMEVEFASIVFTMKTLRGLGYKNLHNVEEMFVDVGHKEVFGCKDFGC